MFASGCDCRVLKEWRGSSRKCESGKRVSKVNHKTELALFPSSVTVGVSFLEMNKSVLAKTPLMIS